MQTVVRCHTCQKDISDKAQVFDWETKEKKKRVVRCLSCNVKVKL